MNDYPPTIIIRHRKENLKKCSLSGLERRPDFVFLRYPLERPLPSLNGYILLTVDAPIELSAADHKLGLLIIDATWRYAGKMIANIPQTKDLICRRLPRDLTTAYPRRQDDCSQPSQGLSSIEAIYCAYSIMCRSNNDLLDHYHWKEAFLKKNKESGAYER